MRPQVEFRDWGAVDYAEALTRQRAMFDELRITNYERNEVFTNGSPQVARSAGRREPAEVITDSERGAGWLVLCEHPHVYTLGRSGKEENLLVSEDFLRSRGAALHRIERGGDITYHGPGQIVGYPILDLERVGMGLRRYIETLEQAVIETVSAFDIEAGRAEGKTGVWIKDAKGERKICAMGVKASRGVVMHGFALNVSTDLGWFELINPCGMVGGAVTSIERETGRTITLDEVKRLLCERLNENLKINIKN